MGNKFLSAFLKGCYDGRKEGWLRVKRALFLFLGGVTFVLGTIGIFVPFMPTTGFYLLTSFFWMRSSEKTYQWFIQSKYYQAYIVEIFIERNISTKGMLRMFGMMGVVFALPIVLVSSPGLKLFLGLIYLAHVIGLTWYLKLKPKKIKLEQTRKDLKNS